MNTKWQVIFASLVLMQSVILPMTARAGGGAMSLLPARSTWTLRWDSTLDGKLKAPEAGVSWGVDVCNNRIHVDGGQSVITGEIIDAKWPVFTLRQDDTRGFVAIYTGKLTSQQLITGTWFNTKGESGDFELVIND